MNQQKMGMFIRNLRKEKGLTQEQLAEYLNVSSRTVSRWETGSNMPDIDVLVVLADFFEVDIRELINGERLETHMDKQKQEALLEVADYCHQKESALVRKTYAVIVSGIFAWIFSFIFLFNFSNSAIGVEIVLFLEAISVLIYSLCMLCVKANRSASGYISALVGAFVAVVLSNIILLIYFFGTGDYYNHGSVGVYLAVLVFIFVFGTVGVITSFLNRRDKNVKRR